VVNREKTHVTSVGKGVPFLGFVIYPRHISIHPKRVRRFKERVRQLTPRNHGEKVEAQIAELNRFLRGWINYFRLANCQTFADEMMGWIRRRLRMKQMREWKTWRALHRALRQQGCGGNFEKPSMRRWWNSASPLLSLVLPNRSFEGKGLIDLTRYEVGVLHRYAP